MSLVPEIVQEILSFLPRSTYNQVYNVKEESGLYDTIPEEIEIFSGSNRWDFNISRPHVRYVRDVEELVLLHYSFPIIPANKTIILNLKDESFLQLHEKHPSILASYRLKIENATLELNHLDMSSYETVCVNSETGAYGCRFATELTVDTNYIFISELLGDWNKINITCKPGSDFNFNHIKGWKVNKLKRLKISNGGKLLKDFRCPSVLETLELESDFSNLPQFDDAKLKRLTISATNNDSFTLKVPETIEELQVHNGYGGEYEKIANINYNSGIKSLTLSHFAKSSSIPKSLVNLKLAHCDGLRDFTPFQSLENLEVYYYLVYDEQKIEFPLSLKRFKTNGFVSDIKNFETIESLETLQANIQEADVITVPPNIKKLALNGRERISRLELNNRIKILEIDAFLLTSVKFPDSLRYLDLYDYTFSLELPSSLEFLRIRNYSLPLKTPENLRYLTINRERIGRRYVGMNNNQSNSIIKAELELNGTLKYLVLDKFEIDFKALYIPTLEAMSLSNCVFDASDVNMDLVEDDESFQVCVFRKKKTSTL